MAWTRWHTPNRVAHFEVSEIEFGFDFEPVPDVLVSDTPVKGVSLSYGDLTTSESNALLFSDFGFSYNGVVQGVEMRLHVSRLARIQDKLIHLYQNAKLRGRNKANLQAEDVWVYGGPNDLWYSRKVNFDNPEFGVVIDLQPHTQYPSSNLVYLRDVRMRLNVES